MEATTQKGTQEILDHHLSAFVAADLNELIKDYTETSELLTPNGAMKGLQAIQSFFGEVFTILPEGSTLEVKQTFIRDKVAYITWSAASSLVDIPLGTDSFIMDQGKISVQTLAAHIVPKQQ